MTMMVAISGKRDRRIFGTQYSRMVTKVGMFSQLRWLLFALAALALFSVPVPCHAQKVGTLMRTTTTCQSYFDNGFTLTATRYSAGEKVILVSKFNGTARIIGTDGSDCFVPVSQLEFVSNITRSGVRQRIAYFLGQLRERPYDQPYIDTQAAPWVALLARALEQRESDQLPALSVIGQTGASSAAFQVTNETQYTLRIVLRGPKSIVREVTRGQTWREEVPGGSYDAFVEATSGNVRALRSSWNAEVGMIQGIRLFIRRSYY
jgi:hypothetical protein